MMISRPFIVCLSIALLGVGCGGGADFTYSDGNQALPPPVFQGNEPTARPAPTGPMALTSPAFEEGQPIPEIYTCNGSDFSPPVAFANVPLEAAGLALMMEDLDAPEGFVHWAVFNMPAATVTGIVEGDIAPGALGTGSGERLGYEGPCPPDGQHRYQFTLYAVRGVVNAEDGATPEQIRAALEGQVVTTATLMGTYGK